MCPCDHEHAQGVVIEKLQLVFGNLAVLDTVVRDPRLEQSSGSWVSHDYQVQGVYMAYGADGHELLMIVMCVKPI